MVSARGMYQSARSRMSRRQPEAPKQGRVRRAAGAVGRGAKRGASAVVGRTWRGRAARLAGAGLVAGGVAAYRNPAGVGAAAGTAYGKARNMMPRRKQG